MDIKEFAERITGRNIVIGATDEHGYRTSPYDPSADRNSLWNNMPYVGYGNFSGGNQLVGGNFTYADSFWFGGNYEDQMNQSLVAATRGWWAKQQR